ncbi:hypothetical protein V1290_003176 [Bradyrhizobium sp. AZCC 1578]
MAPLIGELVCNPSRLKSREFGRPAPAGGDHRPHARQSRILRNCLVPNLLCFGTVRFLGLFGNRINRLAILGALGSCHGRGAENAGETNVSLTSHVYMELI